MQPEEEGNPVTRKAPIVLHRPQNVNNGLQLNDFYLPEELIVHILSFVNGKDLLRCSEVCCGWHQIVKEGPVWRIKYEREHRKKPKLLPWYVYYCLFATSYFNSNLVKNGNGEDNFNHWQMCGIWKIENPTLIGKPPPANVPELSTSCFVACTSISGMIQRIDFQRNALFCSILDVYQPDICISEWCIVYYEWGATCIFQPSLIDEHGKILCNKAISKAFKPKLYTSPNLEKVQIVFDNYGPGVKGVRYYNCGQNRPFMSSPYRRKVAGCLCRINFDSIEPLQL